MNVKPAFAGNGLYWHSDFETWHAEDGMPAMRAVSISIALTENHVHNGGLMIMPGSHRTYVSCVGETPADHYRESQREQEIGTPDPDSLCVENACAEPFAAPGRRPTFIASRDFPPVGG